MKISIDENKIFDDVLVFQGVKHSDNRGYFQENFNKNNYPELEEFEFVQDNISFSKQNVLRGLHLQKSNPQGKLVSCISGEVFDVIADVNPHSKNFGKHFTIYLNDENNKQVWVPPGYAHGFCVISKFAQVIYKCTNFYDPKDEFGVNWNDKTLNINWPITNPIISEKDKKLGFL